MTGHYGYGDPFIGKDGEPYRCMKTRWWDISASAILNLSRLFLGYEGYNSPRLMNQFMLAAGIGGVHHLGYGHSYGSDNEWSGHLELQYSRFFTRSKRFHSTSRHVAYSISPTLISNTDKATPPTRSGTATSAST